MQGNRSALHAPLVVNRHRVGKCRPAGRFNLRRLVARHIHARAVADRSIFHGYRVGRRHAACVGIGRSQRHRAFSAIRAHTAGAVIGALHRGVIQFGLACQHAIGQCRPTAAVHLIGLVAGHDRTGVFHLCLLERLAIGQAAACFIDRRHSAQCNMAFTTRGAHILGTVVCIHRAAALHLAAACQHTVGCGRRTHAADISLAAVALYLYLAVAHILIAQRRRIGMR